MAKNESGLKALFRSAAGRNNPRRGTPIEFSMPQNMNNSGLFQVIGYMYIFSPSPFYNGQPNFACDEINKFQNIAVKYFSCGNFIIKDRNVQRFLTLVDFCRFINVATSKNIYRSHCTLLIRDSRRVFKENGIML